MNEDALRTRLNELHRTMSWRQIAQLPEFYGISFGTIAAWANGRPINNPIHRRQLGLPDNPSCGMCWKFNKYIQEAVRPPRKWRDMPSSHLRNALQQREEIK